ncbi:hypothetical protein [Nonlabens sp.]|uniref:hypothetical protein n=1 Tax=Nonlabens sp. TaxID=1888209 RepID=UPI003F69B362
MSKKIYFVCAPIFLYWPVEISKKIKELNNGNLITGGFIGGPKKYYQILKNEWGTMADEVVYTHDLEHQWISTPYEQKQLLFFAELLGHKRLNQFIISDRHIGNGLLMGGGIADSPFLEKIRKDKEATLNYIVNMLSYLYNFLSKTKPEIIYSYAVAGAFTLAIAELCVKLDIKFLKLTHSRIDNKVVIDSSPRDKMDLVKAQFLKPISDFSKDSLDYGLDYLNKFREKQQQPDYQILQNKIYLEKTKIKYSLKLAAKYLKGTFNRSNEFFHTSYLSTIKYEYNITKGIKSFWKQKPFFDTEYLLKKSFLFYTLHVDPEASTMVISSCQTNQLAVIEAISKSKAITDILVVKEHLTMIGRRPKGFYKAINALPGVYMANPTEPSFRFINAAKAIITLTGTSGLESIFLNKPAVFLGDFIYRFIDKGFVCTNDLSRLNQILANLDKIETADDEVLIKLIAAVNEVSFPFDGGLVWSGVSKQKVLDHPEVVNLFAEKIFKNLS